MDTMKQMGEGEVLSAQGPKTVLQILCHFEPTPGLYDALALVDAQRKTGGRTLVVSEGGALAYEFERRGAEIIQLPPDSRAFWRRGKNTNGLPS